MTDFEIKLETIAARAWETWTNGFDLDDDLRFQTMRTAQDFAGNSYGSNMTDDEWLSATIAALEKATGRV